MNKIVRYGLEMLPTKIYLQLMYFYHFRKFINWNNPKTYNEKLQWLKTYDHNPLYIILVDKIKIKEWVSKSIGNEFVIPTLGTWNKGEEINFEALPNQFVLKTNHSGGGSGVVICKDKNNFDQSKAIKKLNDSLKTDTYKYGREWPYKNVERKILAETFIYQKDSDDLNDYKFYCFGGRPYFVLISHERSNGNVKFDYFDMNFNHLNLRQGGDNYKGKIKKPIKFELMKELATKLSQHIPHVRVDFYEVDGQIFFGEMTLFDSSGFASFEPEKWDYIWGKLIQLPVK